MKTGLRITFLVLITVSAIQLTTCNLLGVSITDRISSFVNSLNGDRSNTYQNLDPSISTYSTSNPTYWDALFNPSYAPYSFTPNPPNTSNPSDVEVTITGTGGSGYSVLNRFVMVNIGTASDDWRIHNLSYYSSGWVQDF